MIFFFFTVKRIFNSACQFLVLFPVLLELFSECFGLCMYREVFSLVFTCTCNHFQSFKSFVRIFNAFKFYFHEEWGEDLVSFFYIGNPVFPARFVKEAVSSPVCIWTSYSDTLGLYLRSLYMSLCCGCHFCASVMPC